MNPTNEGDDITIKVTASDTNGDDWYLAICKSSSIATSTGAPTCPGTAWTITATTTSATEQIATIPTTGVSATSSAWYAFACDSSVDQKCSTVSTGTGTAAQNSPFNVNHRPSFTVIGNDGGKNPGETVTWSSTASDSDKFSVDDWLGLYICSTESFATGTTPGCVADTWCSATSTSDTTCGYSIPSPKPDTTYVAYSYIVDNHGFDASGGSQAEDTTYTVNNTAPTIAAGNISLVDSAGDTNLDLTIPEGETTGFKVNAIISDTNSCDSDEIATSSDGNTTYAWVYRSGATSACEADPNDCYLALAECTLGPCEGTSDPTVTTTCAFDMWYVADPTDESSYYPSDDWKASVKVVDDNSASSTTEGSSGSTMISYMASDLVTNITLDYGIVGLGAESSEATTTIKAIGNVGLDEDLSGVDMESGVNTMAIDQQHYNLVTDFAWADGTTATSVPAEAELNSLKTISTSTPATSSTYWVIKIPAAQTAGTYSGTNTVTGVISETSTWY